MNEKWKKRCQKAKMTPIQIMTVDNLVKEAYDEVERIYTQKSFLLMLAIPLNVLINDYWSDDQDLKNKTEDFVKECLSLMDTYSNDGISYGELAEYVREWSGVDFTAPWMADVILKRESKEIK